VKWDFRPQLLWSAFLYLIFLMHFFAFHSSLIDIPMDWTSDGNSEPRSTLWAYRHNDRRIDWRWTVEMSRFGPQWKAFRIFDSRMTTLFCFVLVMSRIVTHSCWQNSYLRGFSAIAWAMSRIVKVSLA
jgi:hypothetical protein